MKGGTVLLSGLSPDMEWEDEFNEWYDDHQIPGRMEVPGFVSAQRYRDRERPNYLTVYEITGTDVLDSPDYMKVKSQPNARTAWMLANMLESSRYLGNEICDRRRDDVDDEESLDAPILYAVFFSVPDDRVEEFNRWYDEEHIPLLLKCKDWLRVRRFDIYEGEPQPWTHLALHYLADISAFESAEREAARTTDLYKKLSEEAWFRAGYLEYDALGERFSGKG